VSRQTSAEPTQLTWFDRSGRPLGTLGEPGDYWGVELAPDNTRVAVVVHRALSGYFAIWMIDVARNLATPFSVQSERSTGPVWSPDGRRLYFKSGSRNEQIFSKALDESGPEHVLSSPGRQVVPLSISPDARYLLAARYDDIGGPRALVYSALGKDEWRPLLGSHFWEDRGTFSPDGKWVAYQSNESGTHEIWVTDFPEGRQKHRVSERGGREPRWSHDGKELFYVSADDTLMAAAIADGPESARSVPLFRPGAWPGTEGRHYAVSNDGQKFLVQAGRLDQSRTLNVLFNWPQILRAAGR
jgi:Tol biopolymer transport system component